MPKIEITLTVEQIAEGVRQLSEGDQRKLAALLLQDRQLEPFVEELEDSLACEKAAEEGPAGPFTPDELTHL
ncbi:MAG: hypothetical protein HY652_10915 [Acidobacteria bacterium]|nr:hypothetical protein [Acidobacteriota bacterium]